jgi:hypothetical protein
LKVGKIDRFGRYIHVITNSTPGGSSGHHSSSDDAPRFSIVRSEITVAGQSHHISGIIAPTGGPEDHMIFGSLGHVQALTNKPDHVNVIEVSALCKGCPAEDW